MAATALPTIIREVQDAGHEDTVFDVAWIPRGSTAHKLGARLLSASHDLTLRAWGLSVAQVTHGTQGPI